MHPFEKEKEKYNLCIYEIDHVGVKLLFTIKHIFVIGGLVLMFFTKERRDISLSSFNSYPKVFLVFQRHTNQMMQSFDENKILFKCLV